ncbi:MAG TPA: putative lipid II flippase FtsW [Candidatus Omnitrophota bacterium]|nr:putative lipid II flippase FtsW [Candidatus Omnitrophota bacterium]HPN88428.1 putative lipid II flippase FtsW [Candidatus Omnitrophota bacterium]
MKNLRTSLAIMVLCLISFGIVMIYSASGIFALKELKDSMYFLNRHLIFLFIGGILTIVMMSFDYRELKRWIKPLLILSIILLVLVLIPGIGKASSGARRWFKIGFFSFQPSEFVKLVVLIYMADFLSRKQAKVSDLWRGFLPPFFVMGVICLLVVKQPDLGNAVLIASSIFVMLFIAGTRISYLGAIVMMAIPALYFLITKVAYRMKRIISFIDPWKDSLGVGFQLTQSQIALGAGGLWGVGLGHSTQKLFYLPAAHTDFIFSIIGEELGLLGTLIVIFLFMGFIWQGARIAKRTTDSFGYFLATGIVAMLGMQAVVNIGVSIGALPTKGLPLPFISYGGSALIFNMMAVGILLNISRIEDLTKEKSE